MEEIFIDVRNTRAQYQRALARFNTDQTISDHNRELVLAFVRDAALGKTLPGRGKKRIGPSRLLSYLYRLHPLMQFCGKDLDALTQTDLERFVEGLDNDQIRARSTRLRGGVRRDIDAVLSPRYKVDIKITVKKFYKWLLGGSRTFPPLVEWIDTYMEPKEVPALTVAEVERLVDRCRLPVHRALVQVLFDGGFRIGELLNVRLRHVWVKELEGGVRCFCLRAPFSKTLRRTVILPLEMTRRTLTRWLEDHPARPVVQPDGTLKADDPESPLFPLTDNAIRLHLNRVGRAALGKRVYPHLLRHTSATFWCNRLPYFVFCKRFGWTMTSKMPQRYIDREGVDKLRVAELYHQQERERVGRENERLRTRSLPKAMRRTTGCRNAGPRDRHGPRCATAASSKYHDAFRVAWALTRNGSMRTASSGSGAASRSRLGRTTRSGGRSWREQRKRSRRNGVSLELDRVYALEARDGLRQLDDDSVDCVVTSPPYWAVRTYSVEPTAWADGATTVLGLEPSIDIYLDHLLEVFTEVRRVLKPSGTLWVNLGDVYASGTRSRVRGPLHGLMPVPSDDAFRALPDKTLCLIPSRFALRMVESGWTLRNTIVWHKPNFLPASVRDRFACSWEPIYLFAKSERYFFDMDAVRAPHRSANRAGSSKRWRIPGSYDPRGKNPGDVWLVATRGEGQSHPAPYPERLCERPILAGCPIGGLVVDPFAGSGTTCVGAKRLGCV
ncbi:MAG: DNA methyltransferase [Phycisphaerales bacterium]